ncbi:TonB-dependent hemoglobin/transferrin/lactoferrin family receptor [Actinobacillus seminis]|uniref:TonB-dependent hemoglobin/transferrin/lactoferrin family receptor n=1 Tax=Actinobacillus seminis TaxID=722 RepID=UPI003B954EAB
MLFISFSTFLLALRTSYAKEPDFLTLETINVETNNVLTKNTQVNSDYIRRGLVWDERDLIRNQTGITVTEGGRAGTNGYTMRGVDSDRVQISIDNVSAIESYMPRFYYIKGFYNGNRNSTEIENLAAIDFTKGANSLSGGSGALGGSVVMRTKNPQDLVLPGNSVGLYSKSGYASKNNEFRQVLGLGVVHQGLEALVQFTRRKAKETKNYYSGKIDDIAHCGIIPYPSNEVAYLDLRIAYPNVCGRGRLLPDNMDYNTTSWLAKLGYRFNSTHFISSFYEDLHQDRNIEEKSFYLANRQKVSDTTPYRRYGLIYEYPPENTWLHRLGLQFTHQEVYQKSNSFQYRTGIKTTYNPTPDWNLITDTRVYEFQQNRYQFDTELKTTDFQVLSTTYSLTFGSGFHIGKLTNRNVEHKYNAYSKQTTTKKFTIQQPVKTQLIYGYIKDNIMINDKFGMNTGIRIDQYRYKPQLSHLKYENTKEDERIAVAPKKKFSSFNYSFDLNYFINDDTTLSYNISSGLKAPKVEEMYFDMRGRSNINYMQNPDLKPEKVQTHELTFNTEKERYVLSISLFYTQYRDFIAPGYQPIIGTRARKNWSTGDIYKEYVLGGVNYN